MAATAAAFEEVLLCLPECASFWPPVPSRFGAAVAELREELR